MESLYQIACDSTVDLHTRYNAIKIMLHIRATDPVDYTRVQVDRIKRKRRREKLYRTGVIK